MTKKTLLAAALGAALLACGKERTSSGPICVGGECTADVYVACFATDEVKGFSSDLVPGPTFAADDGPIALDFGQGALWVSHSLGAPTLLRFAPGAQPARSTLGGGGDLQEVRVQGGLVYTTNSTVSTIAVVDPARNAAIDEVTLTPAPGTAVFPQGFDFDASGNRAYVALYGNAQSPSYQAGQEIAVVQFTNEQACVAPPCGQVVKRISFEGVPGAADAGGFPFPSRVLRVANRMYVTLSNLKLGGFGFYTDPAGSGRLAVIDAGANDALSIVDLGVGCTNPGGIAADGAVVYVSCSNGAVVPVNTAGATPSVGAPIPVPVVAGQIAMCKGSGFVTDQFSGKVVRFSPQGQVTGELDVCPVSAGPFGFAWAADVECGP